MPRSSVSWQSIRTRRTSFRCNQIVRNIDEFYTTFDVTDADALWLPEEERVTIW